MGTGPHQVLVDMLTLLESGGQIMLATNACPHKVLKATDGPELANVGTYFCAKVQMCDKNFNLIQILQPITK